METKQPKWECVGFVGDIDPIAHGGAFVYIDQTGIYAPEMTWFEPGTDEQWKELREQTPLQQYRVLLERESQNEWWHSKLDRVSSSTGVSLDELKAMAESTEPKELAQLYEMLIRHFGIEEFDSYPVEMTEGEAYEKYAEELRTIRRKV